MNIRFMVHFNLPPLYGGPMILQYYQNMKNIFAAKIFSLPCPTVQRSSCLNKKKLSPGEGLHFVLDILCTKGIHITSKLKLQNIEQP